MEVDLGECRNYRLRLGLPELSQPFFGSWLSPDSLAPPDSFFFDSHSHFPPSEPASASASPPSSFSPSPRPPLPPLPSDGSDNALAAEPLALRTQEEKRVESCDDVRDDKDEGEGHKLEPQNGVELSNLWLHAGKFSEGQPRRLDWEVTNVREEVLGLRSSAAISGKVELGSRTGDLLSNSSNAENELENLRSMHFNFDSIQEADLVRAALRAMQGVPTAVSWLEQLAANFSSTAADRSSENFTTLWTRSSSSCSLSKVLTEFAKAGRVACQLDYFTSFFLNQQTDPHMVGTSGMHNSFVGDSGRKKRKRQNFMTERSSDLQLETKSELWEDVEGPNISPHCHTNQAFAAAVRIFVQGNLASLDKIRASVQHRRQIALGGRSEQFSKFMDGEAGLVFGFGSGDVTLLELFLHSHKQREQLQALAALCRIHEGNSLVSSSYIEVDKTHIKTEDVNMKSSPFEMETHLFSASKNAFKEFPRGADLLSYLFDKLSEADTLHLELIRFLFERACQPYIVFIRSWLYLATVQDPFGEFFVKAVPSTSLMKRPGGMREQDVLLSYEIPEGITVPCFLEEVCTPLLRAGQQLQVLSKLLDAPSASKIVDSHFKSSGSFQDTLLSFTCWSEKLINKSTPDGPVLFSSNTFKQGDADLPKRSSQMLKGFPDVSLARLAKSPLFQQETERSRLMERTRSSNDFQPSGTEDNTRQKSWATKDFHEPDVKVYEGTIARAALFREEAVDDIPIAPSTRQECSESLLQSPRSFVDKSKELHAGQCLKSRFLNQVYPLNSEFASSFISDFQRGTSWPVLGLPKNPFLSFRDEVDNSFSYIYTVFPENNGCWDVNIHWMDPYSVTRNEAQSLTAEQDWPTSESRFVFDDQNVDVNHPLWLKDLEDYLSKQLTAGLDEQILEAHYGGFECQFDKDNDYKSADSLGFQPWGSSTRPHVLQRNGGKRLQANSDWAFGDSSLMDTFEKQQLDDNCLHRKNDTGVESPLPEPCSVVDDAFVKHDHLLGAEYLEAEDGKSPNLLKANVWDSIHLQSFEFAGPAEISQPIEESLSEGEKVISGAYYVGTGTKWESYLHYEYQQIMDVGYLQHAPSCDDDEEDDDEIPLSVAIKLWIDEEILYQYKRTSMLTIRLLQESLHLQDHFTALRRYYFMERGDWAEYFLSALCKYEWNRLVGEPQLLEVQRMLGTAVQNSSCDGDDFADRLYVVQSGFDGYQSGLSNPLSAISRQQHSLGTFVDCNKIDAFDFIKVGYKVEWPLCLIITPSALSRYSAIFTFLLRMKLTICALADVWRNLQGLGYSLNKGRRSSSYQEQNKKFRTLQHFRQQIGHVVTTLQRYTESQILHAVWSKFLYSIENEVNDIQDLEKVHSVYLDDAFHQCFLSKDMEEAKNCIDIIMQCTLDFRNTLHAAGLEHSRDLEPVDDVVFDKVMGVKSIFEEHLQKLYSFHQRPEPQYSVLLSDFWMCLNYNGCLKAKT